MGKSPVTRKLQPKRANLVMYRDRSGNWRITGYSNLDLAVAHATRLITSGKATKVLLTHILYEESRGQDVNANDAT